MFLAVGIHQRKLKKAHHPCQIQRQERPHPQLLLRMKPPPQQQLPKEALYRKTKVNTDITQRMAAFHRVLLSHGRMYHATCTFLCQWSRRLHRVYDGKPCLRVLENRFQERQYTRSK
ncbi:hypothetical protein MRX96_035972, partial [Rhipicephalus microplus]